MSDLQVLEEVSTPVVGVPPRHRGTDGTHHLSCIAGVLGSAVFDQAVLVQVLAVAVRAGEGEAIRYWTDDGRLALGRGPHSLLNVFLVF